MGVLDLLFLLLDFFACLWHIVSWPFKASSSTPVLPLTSADLAATGDGEAQSCVTKKKKKRSHRRTQSLPSSASASTIPNVKPLERARSPSFANLLAKILLCQTVRHPTPILPISTGDIVPPAPKEVVSVKEADLEKTIAEEKLVLCPTPVLRTEDVVPPVLKEVVTKAVTVEQPVENFKVKEDDKVAEIDKAEEDDKVKEDIKLEEDIFTPLPQRIRDKRNFSRPRPHRAHRTSRLLKPTASSTSPVSEASEEIDDMVEIDLGPLTRAISLSSSPPPIALEQEVVHQSEQLPTPASESLPSLPTLPPPPVPVEDVEVSEEADIQVEDNSLSSDDSTKDEDCPDSTLPTEVPSEDSIKCEPESPVVPTSPIPDAEDPIVTDTSIVIDVPPPRPHTPVPEELSVHQRLTGAPPAGYIDIFAYGYCSPSSSLNTLPDSVYSNSDPDVEVDPMVHVPGLIITTSNREILIQNAVSFDPTIPPPAPEYDTDSEVEVEQEFEVQNDADLAEARSKIPILPSMDSLVASFDDIQKDWFFHPRPAPFPPGYRAPPPPPRPQPESAFDSESEYGSDGEGESEREQMPIPETFGKYALPHEDFVPTPSLLSPSWLSQMQMKGLFHRNEVGEEDEGSSFFDDGDDEIPELPLPLPPRDGPLDSLIEVSDEEDDLKTSRTMSIPTKPAAWDLSSLLAEDNPAANVSSEVEELVSVSDVSEEAVEEVAVEDDVVVVAPEDDASESVSISSVEDAPEIEVVETTGPAIEDTPVSPSTATANDNTDIAFEDSDSAYNSDTDSHPPCELPELQTYFPSLASSAGLGTSDMAVAIRKASAPRPKIFFIDSGRTKNAGYELVSENLRKKEEVDSRVSWIEARWFHGKEAPSMPLSPVSSEDSSAGPSVSGSGSGSGSVSSPATTAASTLSPGSDESESRRVSIRGSVPRHRASVGLGLSASVSGSGSPCASASAAASTPVCFTRPNSLPIASPRLDKAEARAQLIESFRRSQDAKPRGGLRPLTLLGQRVESESESIAASSSTVAQVSLPAPAVVSALPTVVEESEGDTSISTSSPDGSPSKLALPSSLHGRSSFSPDELMQHLEDLRTLVQTINRRRERELEA